MRFIFFILIFEKFLRRLFDNYFPDYLNLIKNNFFFFLMKAKKISLHSQKKNCQKIVVSLRISYSHAVNITFIIKL